MAINAAFDEELAEVDGTKSFSVTINTSTYTENEFSVSGYTITAGSDAAAEHAASQTLYDLGYRFWSPNWKNQPASLPSGGVTIAKTERTMPFSRMYNNYGFHPQDATGLSDFNRFVTLNGCNDNRRPVGHAWGGWYNDDTAWFDANPSYWSLSGSRVVFDLANATAFEQLAQRAAFWIDDTSYLNANNRGSWDAPDGDTLSADLVWPWAARVVAILRSTYGITDAELGVYAYGGHRDYRDVIGEDLTGIYGQVALGFNDLGLGYPALVDGWGGVLDGGMLSLRGYGDIAAQEGYLLPYAGGSNLNFLNDYDQFITSGANGVNFETSSNWLKNVVSHYTAMRVWAQGGTPSTVYANVLSDVVDTLFEGDSAVADFFTLLDNNSRPSGFLMKDAFAIVEGMQSNSWWKERFQQFMAIQSNLLRIEADRDFSGPYFTLVEETMRWCEGVHEIDGAIHAYAIQRQEAGVGRTTNEGRGDLEINGTPLPHYYRFPSVPSVSQITSAKNVLDETYYYPSVAAPPNDVADWIEITPPAPQGAADVAATDAADDNKSIGTRYTARFIFSGPGNVTVANTDGQGTPEVTAYGSGLHNIVVTGSKTTSWDTGTLYLVCVPTVTVESLASDLTVWWAFLPSTLTGWHLIEALSRLSTYDEDGRKDVKLRTEDFTSGYRPQDLKPGTICIYHQTTGQFTLAGANPAISPARTTMLMPRSLAEREGLV